MSIARQILLANCGEPERCISRLNAFRMCPTRYFGTNPPSRGTIFFMLTMQLAPFMDQRDSLLT